MVIPGLKYASLLIAFINPHLVKNTCQIKLGEMLSLF